MSYIYLRGCPKSDFWSLKRGIMRYGKLNIEKVYWTTKEVSELTGVPDYTLRYWEKVVPYLQVPRNRAKNRAWRKQDIEFVKALKAMLMEEAPEVINQPSPTPEEPIPTIVSHEPLLEDGAKPQLAQPAPVPPPPAETSPAVENPPEDQAHKPDHEVLLKLRSELLLAMSKLRQ